MILVAIKKNIIKKHVAICKCIFEFILFLLDVSCQCERIMDSLNRFFFFLQVQTCIYFFRRVLSVLAFSLPVLLSMCLQPTEPVS